MTTTSRMIPKCLKPYVMLLGMIVTHICAAHSDPRPLEDVFQDAMDQHRELFFLNCDGAYSGNNANVFSAIYCTVAFLIGSGITATQIYFQQALCGLGNEFPCNTTVSTGGGNKKGGKHRWE